MQNVVLHKIYLGCYVPNLLLKKHSFGCHFAPNELGVLGSFCWCNSIFHSFSIALIFLWAIIQVNHLKVPGPIFLFAKLLLWGIYNASTHEDWLILSNWQENNAIWLCFLPLIHLFVLNGKTCIFFFLLQTRKVHSYLGKFLVAALHLIPVQLQSDDISRVARASKIVERMVNQNTFDDVAQGKGSCSHIMQTASFTEANASDLLNQWECIFTQSRCTNLFQWA